MAKPSKSTDPAPSSRLTRRGELAALAAVMVGTAVSFLLVCALTMMLAAPR